MKSKQKSTSTTTPLAPAWVSPQVESLSGKTADLANQDPYSFVAGPDALQTKAAAGASGLTQNGQSYDTANSVLTGMANSGSDPYQVATVHPNSILPNLDAYMSPYLKNVVDSSLANYDFGAGQTRAQNALARANSDTFGGSGGDIQTAMSNAQMARDRGQLSYGLLNEGFGVGSNLANLDANRRQEAQLANMAAFNNARQFGLTNAHSAANDLVNVDTARNADRRAALGTQMDMGSILQSLQQAKQGAPLTAQSAINGAYGSLVPAEALLTGSTSTSKSSSGGGLGSILGGLGSLAMGVGTGGLGSLFTGGQMLGGLGNSLGGLKGLGAGLNLSPVNVLSH